MDSARNSKFLDRKSRFSSLTGLAILLVASGTLAAEVFRGKPLGHSLLNVEGAVSIAFLLLILFRSETLQISPQSTIPIVLPGLALAFVVAIAYFPILRMPFQYDDYTHIFDAASSTWATILAQFGPVARKPGLFFRPFGFLVYWSSYLWAGADPWRWHFLSIMLHLANCFLLWAFCIALEINRRESFGAALFFGLNPVSVEAVAWIDARFDLLTTCFVLIALISVCRYLSSSRFLWLLVALSAGACSVLTKESAFCLPLLLACLAFFRTRKDWPRLRIACVLMTALFVGLFAYRWWALGGIGGYRSPSHELEIARVGFLRTLNALLVRDWAILLFPVNWSVPLSVFLRAALVAALPAVVACMWRARISRRRLFGCLAFTLAAALPVQHLLLLDTDLHGSRLLYLGAVGVSVLWGTLLGATDRAPWRVLTIGCVLALQLSLTRHNLSAWQSVSQQARSVCAEFGLSSVSVAGPIVVRGLPREKNGVVFLANGFPECVEMSTGFPRGRIHVENSTQANFVWNDETGRIEAVRAIAGSVK